jgi:hypothetical protein
MPFGYEEDRIVLPAKEQNAERVVLLEEPGPDQPQWFQDVRDELREAGITVETESCDIMDMYSVIKAVARVAQRHEDDQVYVNLSTGSKLSAIGGMIACMSVGNATPYYVEPEHYGEREDNPEPLSHGIADTRELADYPMDGPSREEVWVLAYLKSKSETSKRPKKADLIELGKGEQEVSSGYGPDGELPFISEYSDNETAQYRVLNEHIISPLVEKGWISTTDRGNRTYVDITDEGEDTLRAFRHLIEEA